VTIFDRGGAKIGAIGEKQTGYELREPVDLAYDPTGHLHVLDRQQGAILVFRPNQRFLTAFSIPDRSPGAFTRGRALAVDAAGRLYVYDERARGVQVYQ
jgi:hypothetical protein